MSGDASLSIQTAIFTALSSSGAISALGAQIFDAVPESTVFPYVQIGDDTAKDWDSHSFNGQETTLTIHSWTQGNLGRSDVKALMAAIYSVLHQARLSLSGQALVDIRCEFAHSELDPDGFTYHGVQRFRALTQGV